MRKFFLLAASVMIGNAGCAIDRPFDESMKESAEICSELISESRGDWEIADQNFIDTPSLLEAAGVFDNSRTLQVFTSAANDRIGICRFLNRCDSQTYIFSKGVNGTWEFLPNAGHYRVCLATHNKPLKSFVSLTRTRIRPAPLS